LIGQVKRVVETRFPDVTLSWVDMASSDQVKAVSTGMLDLGIVHTRSDRAAVRRQLIYCEPLVAVLPSNHRLAQLADFQLSMLADEPMVALPRDCGPAIYDSIVACCHEAGFTPIFRHAARSALTIFQMVRLGLGVSIAPASYANTGYAGVVFREFAQTAGQVRLELIWSDKHANALTRRVVSEVMPRLVIGTL